MSHVSLGDNLGSSLGSPEPSFCRAWSLLSSLSLIWNVSSALSEDVCYNFSIFRPSRIQNNCQNLGKAWVLLCFGSAHNLQLRSVLETMLSPNLGNCHPQGGQKAVPPMPLVTLGDNLGSSLGSPEPPFYLSCKPSQLS